MRELERSVAASGQRFYCSSVLGGCGEPLIVVNGVERRPHFRHYARTRCQLSYEAEARDIYTHRMIQDELVRWLRHLGYCSSREKSLDRHSRVDVFCEPNAVIEVQLSAETAASMAERNDRYGGNVTWLFGPTGPLSSRDIRLHEDGVVQLVRLRPLDNRRLMPTITAHSSRRIDIGLCSTATEENPKGTTIWFPLAECTFDPTSGLRTPDFAEAVAEVARYRTVRAAALADVLTTVNRYRAARAATRAERARKERLERIAALQARKDRYSANGTRVTPPPAPREERKTLPANPDPMPGPRPTVGSLNELADWERQFGLRATRNGPWHQALRDSEDYLRRTGWIDGRWASDLPSQLIDPAWAALFRTMTIQSGPVTTIVDQAVDPQNLIVERLAAIDLIDIRYSAAGQLMYETVHDLRFIETPFEWHQPSPWPPAEPR